MRLLTSHAVLIEGDRYLVTIWDYVALRASTGQVSWA
jgi:hypothetical protein